jgi:membrane associated rhomboid family serine protease
MGFIDTIKQEMRIANYTTKIIVVNVIVFLVTNILHHTGIVETPNYLGIQTNIENFPRVFYELFTYMFLHMEIGHVFFNMLLMYFAGRLMEDLLGHRRMLFTYIGGGLFGGLFFLLITWSIYGMHHPSILLGASASVLSVFVACAVYMPEMEVRLFGIFSIRLKWLVVLVFLATTVIDFSVNTGGKLAHLGGALFGLLYVYNLKNGSDWAAIFKKKEKVRAKLKVVHRSENSGASYQNSTNSKSGSDQETLDGLLDKIKKSGYDSLSKSEKDLLNNLSRKI